MQASAACNGPVIVLIEFLSLDATITAFDKAWLYTEPDLESLHSTLAHAAMNGKRLRFNHGGALLGAGVCSALCRQGFDVEFGV